LIKQLEDLKELITNISISKEKEISELKLILDNTTHDFNNQLITKDNLIKENQINFDHYKDELLNNH
jgi:hypothetical protein